MKPRKMLQPRFATAGRPAMRRSTPVGWRPIALLWRRRAQRAIERAAQPQPTRAVTHVHLHTHHRGNQTHAPAALPVIASAAVHVSMPVQRERAVAPAQRRAYRAARRTDSIARVSTPAPRAVERLNMRHTAHHTHTRMTAATLVGARMTTPSMRHNIPERDGALSPVGHAQRADAAMAIHADARVQRRSQATASMTDVARTAAGARSMRPTAIADAPSPSAALRGSAAVVSSAVLAREALSWRTPERRKSGVDRAAAMGADERGQHGDAIERAPRAQPKPVTSAPAQTIDERLVDRLVDDVIRRIERRARNERARHGL
jgi:hypothetical protein